MSNHTPGSWEYVPMLTASENHKGFFVRAEKTTRNGKWALAEVRPGDEDGKLGEANARLIAAAPELLAALKETTKLLAEYVVEVGGCDHRLGICYCGDRITLANAHAAIAKAEGKQ